MSEEVEKQFHKMQVLLKSFPANYSVNIFPSRTLPVLNKKTGINYHVILVNQGIMVSEELYNYMKEQEAN
ncbi:MAG: hypothetical protein V3V41_00295 [Candidatus Heimdallarchaeota archaeon]